MQSTKRSYKYIYKYNYNKHKQQLHKVKSLTGTNKIEPPITSHKFFKSRLYKQKQKLASNNKRILQRIQPMIHRHLSPQIKLPSHGFQVQMRKKSRQRLIQNEAFLLRLVQTKPVIISSRQRQERQQDIRNKQKIIRKNWYETINNKVALLNQINSITNKTVRPQTSKL